jgi:hypothetical protein
LAVLQRVERSAGGDLVGLAPAKAGRVVYYAGEDPKPALIGEFTLLANTSVKKLAKPS